DSTAGPGHAHHLLGHVKRLGREHRAKDADDEVEGLVAQVVEVGRVALLKTAVREARFSGAPVPGLHQIAGDIDTQDISSELRLGHSRRPVAAAEIQDLEAFRDPEPFRERLSALAHRVRDLRKVAFFPQRLVWIHRAVLSFAIRRNDADLNLRWVTDYDFVWESIEQLSWLLLPRL